MKMPFTKNEKGMALMMVLLIITLVMLLGMTVMAIALNNVKMTKVDRSYQSAYYIAESGINIKMLDIKKGVDQIYQQSEDKDEFYPQIAEFMKETGKVTTLGNFETSYEGKRPEAEVSVSGGRDNKFKIMSKGTVDNHSRTVLKIIEVVWVPQVSENSGNPNTAVFVTDFIKLDGGAKIVGEAGTNASSAGSIELDGGATISDKVYVGPGSREDVIRKPGWMSFNNEVIRLSDRYIFELPSFPVYPYNQQPVDKVVQKGSNSYKVISNGNLNVDNYVADNFILSMNQNMKFKEIRLTSNYTLNIDVGDQDRNIVVDSLNVLNGKINIIGNGKLTFYVNNSINMGSGSIINNTNSANVSMFDHIKRLDIYYKGQSLDMSGSQKIYGSLYAERANIDLTAGSGFYGSVITGGDKLTISGGANAVTQFFYAPRAAVTLSGGGQVKGSIIAKSYTGIGGTSVIYDKANIPPEIKPDNPEDVSADQDSQNIIDDPIREE